LPYKLIFRKLTFFSANRFYMLLIIVISITLPALHIRINEPLTFGYVEHHNLSFSQENFELEDFVPKAKQTYNIDWLLMADLAYSLVCAGIFIKLIYSIYRVVKQAIDKGISIGNNYIVRVNHTNNASFFNIIFLHSETTEGVEMEQVLAHEKAHARLLHSADTLFVELVKVFFWFNPFIYLIGSSLKEIHEYEVDDYLKRSFDPKDYATLLLKLLARPLTSLTNQFSAYSLRSRISMLFKARSHGYKKLYYAAIIPLLFLAGYFFSVERVYGTIPVKETFVLVLDAGHGGSNAGALSLDGLKEKDINLRMVKLIKSVADERGIKTILTRSDDRYLDVHDRVNNKADAFISIHMNAAAAGAKKTNGMEIIIDRDSQFSEKLAVNEKNALEQLNGIGSEQQIDINTTSSTNKNYVLSHNIAPAILIELGYMTDKRDMDYMLDPHNRLNIANKIIDAVVTYANAK